MKHNNPVFNKLENNEQVFTGEQASYLGITIKTVLLFVIAIAFGLFTMTLADSNPNLFIGILIASFFTGFISIFVAMLNPRLGTYLLSHLRDERRRCPWYYQHDLCC